MATINKESAVHVARQMTATTVAEARRILREEGYDGTIEEIKEVVLARNDGELKERRWAPGERLLVVCRGALFVAVMKEMGPASAVVRLLYGDEWHETVHANLYHLTDIYRAANQAVGEG